MYLCYDYIVGVLRVFPNKLTVGLVLAEEEKRQQPIEGTVFYKRRLSEFVRKNLLVIFLTAAILLVFSTAIVISTNGRRAFREARAIRTALRFVGTEYYGGNKSIYDATKATGLADGAAEKIKDISTYGGDVYLYQWDEKHNIPLKFEYRKGLYSVQYTDYGVRDEEDVTSYGTQGDWSVSYSLRIMTFKSE